MGGPGRRRRGLGALQTPLCLLALRILLPKLLELRGPSFRAPPCHTPILGVYIFPALAMRPHPSSSTLLPVPAFQPLIKCLLYRQPRLWCLWAAREGDSPHLCLLPWDGLAGAPLARQAGARAGNRRLYARPEVALDKRPFLGLVPGGQEARPAPALSITCSDLGPSTCPGPCTPALCCPLALSFTRQPLGSGDVP